MSGSPYVDAGDDGSLAAPPPARPAGSALAAFHPAVRAWFEARFVHGATEPQLAGWASIRDGHDTLIAAPTGSGKTLAAFLCTIDALYWQAEAGALAPGLQVVYVSPLKALASDIHENLIGPLSEIARVAQVLGAAAPELRVGLRTGDTPAAERARQLRKPPHFLVTTPESLYLLLTANHGRSLLDSVRTVIVDEIHAVAGDKRGVHLSLSLERLSHLTVVRPQRIGLSATQRPVAGLARLLVGCAPPGDGAGSGQARPCRIVDAGHQRELKLSLELHDRGLGAVVSAEALLEIAERIAAHARQCRTTLVFANTRRLAERFAHMLREILGGPSVAAHHGSLSRERRRMVEAALRAGELSVLVATASLELGIDIGQVDLVCQLGSPRSIATFLQRVGRSGHSRFAVPRGVLFPFTRDELVECAALLRAVYRGQLDTLTFPEAPLDILAQQLVAECAAEPWQEDALFQLVRRAAPFAALERAAFDQVLALMVNGIDTGRGKRASFLHRDAVSQTIRGRKGARLAAITSGGAIPDTADYRVVEEPGETFIGTVNEDFAIESMAGDVFLLGSTAWRIRRVQTGVVRVMNAGAAPPSIPFWLGEAPSRTSELSQEVSALRGEIGRALASGSIEDATRRLRAECALSAEAAATLMDYLAGSLKALGVLPTQQQLVVERFFDETGGMQLVVHAPYGARLNRALGLLLRKRFCRSFDFELQAAANDDAVVLSLGPQHSFPLEDIREFLCVKGLRYALVHAVLPTPMFAARWRWNLNRALIVLRRRGGKKVPPQFQRMESDDVMAAVFPSLAACQDNATGPREIPDHPIVNQTLADCLVEAMDADGLEQLLSAVARGEVQLAFRDTTEPSPLAHEILNGRPYTFLDDAPLEERRTRAVRFPRGLPLEGRNLSQLDEGAVERVRDEVRVVVASAESLHELLCDSIAVLPQPGWAKHFEALLVAGRALELGVSGARVWVAVEHLIEASLLYAPQDAEVLRGQALPQLRPLGAVEPASFEAALGAMLRGQLETSGPMTLEQLIGATLLRREDVLLGVAQLEQQGFVLRGAFDPTLPAPHYCARRLLTRIHSYTQARLRREIEPVSPQDYMRFLLDYHGLTEGNQRLGSGGLLAAIEQLQGFEAAAGEWESGLLRSRLIGYAPDLLDSLCLAGGACWARLTVSDAARDARWATISRATPVTVMLRDDMPWLLSAVRRDAVGTASPQVIAQTVTRLLERNGALFAEELVRQSGLSSQDVQEALRDCVARGLVTADGFSALRALISRQSARVLPERRGGLFKGLARGPRDGRWSLVAAESESPCVDELAEAVAEQLLCRYGVVFRDLLVRESFAVPWRDVLWALRRLEARGLVRGGRFVGGFVGEQYALPAAVEQLRELRKAPRTGQVVSFSASDPLNLVGIVVPGPRVPAYPGRVVCLVDGKWLDSEGGVNGAGSSASRSRA